MSPKDAEEIANNVDPDQTALLGPVLSGFTPFAQVYLSVNLGSLRYDQGLQRLPGLSGRKLQIIRCSGFRERSG